MVGAAHVRYAFLELENGLETQLRCGGGCCPRVVGLDRSGEQGRIGALRGRRAEVGVKLPDLVAAEAEAREIVALDEHLDAELARKTREVLDRRRSRLQQRARMLVDQGENAHRSEAHMSSMRARTSNRRRPRREGCHFVAATTFTSR